jgi:hypothetical protein
MAAGTLRLPLTKEPPMKKLVAALALVTALTSLTACGGGGGGGGDRPSSDDIAKALKDPKNSFGGSFSAVAAAGGDADKVIDCIAKVLHDSKVSDDLLQALVDNDTGYQEHSDDQQALTDAITKMGTECVPTS